MESPSPSGEEWGWGMAKGKTANLEMNVWYNAETGHIHIAAPDHFISTISPDPSSKRYHANLYRKLATCLRDLGLPHPNPSPEEEGL